MQPQIATQALDLDRDQQFIQQRVTTPLCTVPYSKTGLLAELPVAPKEKTGWPWMVETQPLPDPAQNYAYLPKITIVTPSYNQGQFIEETIRSVLLQNYPNLEYIVMDGGSTDNTVAILEKYSPWISLWHSERDSGQTDAINKGFQHASGFIRSYLNSDDLLLPNALQRVAQLITDDSEQVILILGNCEMGSSLGSITRICTPTLPASFVSTLSRDGLCPQPATFWTHPENTPYQPFNDRLKFCMDYEFWCQLIKGGCQMVKLDESLAFYRHHSDAKGVAMTNFMWAELAGLPLLELPQITSFNEKIAVTNLSKRRLRHYLRLEIQRVLVQEGHGAAIKALLQASLSDAGFMFERSTIGLARRLLFHPFRMPPDHLID